MTEPEIQELLHRCEREAPSVADLGALEALLAHQEAADGWAEVRASLRAEAAVEQIDVARAVVAEVVAGVVPSAEGGVPEALRALEAGLAEEGARVDVAEAVDAAAGLEPWLPADVLQAFGEGLRAEADGLDLVEAILTAVQEAGEPDLVLSALADGELTGPAREAAAARLAADPEARRFVNAAAAVGQLLRQGLAHEVAAEDLSPIWEGIAAALGLVEARQAEEATFARALAAGLDAEAGSIDIADLVMDRLVPARVAPAVPEQAPPAPIQGPAPARLVWYRRLPVLALLGAAAALLVVLQIVGPDGQRTLPTGVPDAVAPALELAAVNDTEIEDLEVAETAMVQVFQFDDGAPVVIFIDEGPGGESPEGVTL